MLIIAVIVIIFALVYLDDKLGRLILRNGRKKSCTQSGGAIWPCM
ncbi:hypothetical protein JCM14450A_19930 [Geobacillus stearothermophilus]